MSEEDNLERIVEIATLLNAQLHDGNPQAGPIMGSVMGKNPQFRPRAREVSQKVGEMVKKVSQLSSDEIQSRLNELAPKAIEEHEKREEEKARQREEQKKDVTELPNVVKGNFKVRYAPDPSKYPHFGQGINYIINRIFADKYEGEVLLRFDDTNPYIVKPKYYEAIKDGLRWIGATWDEEVKASDYMEEFYDQTRKSIKSGLFYVCFCDGETKRKLAESKTTCDHRNHTTDQNLEFFEKMVSGEYEMGAAIVRLRGDMGSDNNVMRDPIMLRLVDKQHPMQDKMYHVSPTYDFESSYFEAKFGITHVVRSGEFGTMRQELQSFLIDKFGGEIPEFVSFGRINIQGCPTKGRVIRQLVEDGVVEGWDDIRLITLQGIEHRGLHPNTVKTIAQEVGFSPSNTTVAWTTIESKSRQLLEPEAKRIFFVEDPIKLTVADNPVDKITYPFHPEHPDWGQRVFNIDGTFYLSKKDTVNYEEGEIIRLKDLYNIRLAEVEEDVVKAEYAGDKIVSDMDKIQWVTSEYVEGTLKVPLTLEDEKGNLRDNSMHTISGYFESEIKQVNEGDVIQLERVGFAKIKENGPVSGHMVHVY